jgi:hypothetical protein
MAYESLDFLDEPNKSQDTPLDFLESPVAKATPTDSLDFLNDDSIPVPILTEEPTIEEGFIGGITKGVIQSIPESMDNTGALIHSILPKSVQDFLKKTDEAVLKYVGAEDEDIAFWTSPTALGDATRENVTGDLGVVGEISKDISKVILSLMITKKFAPKDLGVIKTIGVNGLRMIPGDLLFWSKNDKHLVDIAAEHDIQWAVVEYLKSDADDTLLEHNLKGVIENALVSTGLEAGGRTLLAGYKGLKGWLRSTGKTADEVTAMVNEIAKKPIVPALTPRALKKAVQKPPETEFNYEKMNISEKKYTEALLKDPKIRDTFGLDKKTQDATRKEALALRSRLGGIEGEIKLADDLAAKTKDLDVETTAVRMALMDASALYTRNKEAAFNTTGLQQQQAITNTLLSLENFTRLAPSVKGAQTSVARTQSAFNMFAFDDRQLRATIDHMTDFPESWNEIMEKSLSKRPMTEKEIKAALKAFDDIDAGADALTASKEALVKDKPLVKFMRVMLENMYNGILSNPTTHKVNMMGNMTSSIARMSEYYGASLIGHGRQVLRVAGVNTKNGSDYVRIGELVALHRGHISGMWDTFKGINTAMKNLPEGVASFEDALQQGFLTNVGKLDEDVAARYLSGDYLEVGGSAGYALDVAGGVNRYALMMLGIEDDMFKRMAFNSHANYMAVREANKKGIKSEKARKTFIREFLEVMELQSTLKNGGTLTTKSSDLVARIDPTNTHYDEAIVQAKEVTYQEELGKAGQDFVKFKKDAFGGAGNIIMPFVKTPTNLIKWLVRRSPGLNVISSKSRAMWAKGGRDRDIVMAQLTLGTSLYGIAYNMYQDNKIVGMLPADLRATYESAGILESSYLTEDGYSIQYNRGDPIASFFNITAAMGHFFDKMERKGLTKDAAFMEHWDEASFAFLSAFSENTLNKTYTQGVKELLRAMDDPTPEKWADYAKTKALMFMPSSGMFRYLNEDSENNRRAAITVVEKVMNLYGMREDLPFLPDEYGKFAPADAKFHGMKMKKIKSSPIRQELVKLGVRLPRLGKKVTFNTIPVELNTKELSDMRHLLESELHIEQQLNDLIGSYEYQRVELSGRDWAHAKDAAGNTVTTKRGLIGDLLFKAHREALTMYIERHPKVAAKHKALFDEKVAQVQANKPTRAEEWLKKGN